VTYTGESQSWFWGENHNEEPTDSRHVKMEREMFREIQHVLGRKPICHEDICFEKGGRFSFRWGQVVGS